MAKKEWVVEADFQVTKEITVLVDDSNDPMDPASWEEVIDETDVDCFILDTIGAELNEA